MDLVSVGCCLKSLNDLIAPFSGVPVEDNISCWYLETGIQTKLMGTVS